jgi:hypothetical protein
VRVGTRLPRQAERAIARIEGGTVVRATLVRAEAIVAAEKMEEIDFLTWKAMSGHAMLRGWAHQLADDDPVLLDELRFFKDTARLGKGEIVADVIDKFRHI